MIWRFFMFYFITIKTNKNSKIFKESDYFRIIRNSIEFCERKYEFYTLGYVLMPDHLHWLMYFRPRQETRPMRKYYIGLKGRVSLPTNPTLEKVIINFKKFTAKSILKLLKEIDSSHLEKIVFKNPKKGNHFYRLWQKSFYCTILKYKEQAISTISYIKNNPVKAGLVLNWQDYKYLYINNNYF